MKRKNSTGGGGQFETSALGVHRGILANSAQLVENKGDAFSEFEHRRAARGFTKLQWREVHAQS
jgi:hypothetical protein